jgi:hypothetical protein
MQKGRYPLSGTKQVPQCLLLILMNSPSGQVLERVGDRGVKKGKSANISPKELAMEQ